MKVTIDDLGLKFEINKGVLPVSVKATIALASISFATCTAALANVVVNSSIEDDSLKLSVDVYPTLG